MSFKTGEMRNQIQMPMSLEDTIAKDNSVRLIDVFVDGLDLAGMGCPTTIPANTGRPPYMPQDFIKLLLYGYMNGQRSSRKLEAECKRNLEVMWLMHGLCPDHSSIATFRSKNSKLLKRIFSRFTLLCNGWNLLSHDCFAVDGTKIRASNGKKSNYSLKTLKEKLQNINQKIETYLNEIEKNDTISVDDVSQKIVELKERKEKYEMLQKKLQDSGENQISTTDPDARLMENKLGGLSVCYNVQTTVDAKSHIIADVRVTNKPTDQGELSKMGRRVKRLLKLKSIATLADKGYYNGKDLATCKRFKIIAIVAKQDPPKRNGDDGYTQSDFQYDEENNSYTCPMGQRLTCISAKETKKPVYANKLACRQCPNIGKCTKSKYRQIIHNEYFHEMREADKVYAANTELYKKRQQIVEHPFGTIKYSMGMTSFLLRTKQKVWGEVCMSCLGYNFKRVLNILGFDEFMERLRAVLSDFFSKIGSKPLVTLILIHILVFCAV